MQQGLEQPARAVGGSSQGPPLQGYSSLSSTLAPASSALLFNEGIAQVPVQFASTTDFNTVPSGLPQCSGPQNDADGINLGIRTQISERSPATLRQAAAATPCPQHAAGMSEADDYNSSQPKAAMIQPQVQHVVISFLAKLCAVVKKKRTATEEIEILSTRLGHLNLRACLSTWTSMATKREPCKLAMSDSGSL